MRIVATLAGIVSVALLAPPAHAHHSYAMYDGSIYRVFTGVIVRVVPNAAHFEMHFVPLNDARDALVRGALSRVKATRPRVEKPDTADVELLRRSTGYSDQYTAHGDIDRLLFHGHRRRVVGKIAH